MIDRRSFIRLAVAGIALGSSVARAQTGTVMRRVGLLSIGSMETEEERRELMIPMRELGWIEGRNLTVERRFANLQVDPLRPYAEELVRLKVEVILTFGTEAAFAAKTATTNIPIVLSSAGDPVGTGLVASLARPGGNITGYSIISSELETKRAALVHELLPAAQRIALSACSRSSSKRRWNSNSSTSRPRRCGTGRRPWKCPVVALPAPVRVG